MTDTKDLIENMVKMKPCCRKPLHILPATPEFFYRNRTKPDGLSSYCKKCQSELFREYKKLKNERDGSFPIGRINYMLEYVDKEGVLCDVRRKTKTEAISALKKIPVKLGQVDGFVLTKCNALCRNLKGE